MHKVDILQPSFEDVDVLNTIGRGGYGEVYKIRIKGSIFAMKRVQKTKSNNEIHALNKLKNHQNIVQLVSNIEYASNNLLIFEFAAHGSVYDLIKKRSSISYMESSLIIKQAVKGVQYIHSKLLVHCDLKASNLLMFPNNVIKICDFGLCHNTNTHLKQPLKHEGSVYWMAPELVHDHKRYYDFKCDIWSIGCIVIEMISGRPPLSNLSQMSALHALGKLRNRHDMVSLFQLRKITNKHCYEFLISCFEIDSAQRPDIVQLEQYPWIHNEKKEGLMKYIENESIGEDDFNLTVNIDLSPQKKHLNKWREDYNDDADMNEGFDFSNDLIINNLIHCLRSESDFDNLLSICNKVFEKDFKLLKSFALSGVLPKILSHRPETRTIRHFKKILCSKREGVEWFKIAGGSTLP